MTIAAGRDVLVSHLMATGWFDGGVNTFEPKAAPTGQFHAAVFLDGVVPVPELSGLAATTYRYTYMVRIFRDMLADPVGQIDPDLNVLADKIIDDINGDFTLGGNVRLVDVLGETGDPLNVRAGYIQVNQSMYRTIDLIMPLVLNDAAAQAA
jgi:hypothetical protein